MSPTFDQLTQDVHLEDIKGFVVYADRESIERLGFVIDLSGTTQLWVAFGFSKDATTVFTEVARCNTAHEAYQAILLWEKEHHA